MKKPIRKGEEKTMERSAKVYVAVEADFSAEGKIMPRSVTWEDGRRFPIDRVMDVRRAASLKAGGAGIRYTVRIGRATTCLYFEEDRWFVERREKNAAILDKTTGMQ